MLKIGHRGAPTFAPANTMRSFEEARRLGCDGVECDCRISADGVVVLAHDPSVRDASGRRHRIDRLTAAELGALDLGGGSSVPTLRELMEWAAGRVWVMADMKVMGQEQRAIDVLRDVPRDSFIVSGADDDSRSAFRLLSPGIPISVTVDARHEKELVRRWSEIDTDAVTFEHPLVTEARVADLHARQVKVYAWTVDDLPTMRQMAAFGVDGIISNRADLLAELG